MNVEIGGCFAHCGGGGGGGRGLVDVAGFFCVH